MEHAKRPQNNTLQTTGNNASKKEKTDTTEKREVRDPGEFGERAEGTGMTRNPQTCTASTNGLRK